MSDVARYPVTAASASKSKNALTTNRAITSGFAILAIGAYCRRNDDFALDIIISIA